MNCPRSHAEVVAGADWIWFFTPFPGPCGVFCEVKAIFGAGTVLLTVNWLTVTDSEQGVKSLAWAMIWVSLQN